jgi:mono/diheme cytochrome c family protein
MTLTFNARSYRSLPILLLLIGITAGCSDLGDPVSSGNTSPPDSLTWVADVWPSVIQPNCSGCHGPSVANAGLNFSDFDEWINEDSGAGNQYVVPGDPASSELVWRLEGSNGLQQMPAGGQLSPSDINAIRTWIEQGAKKQ